MSDQNEDRPFVLPLRVRPLKGKYYGTIIEDAEGHEVLEVWLPGTKPSRREDQEEFYDDHFETANSLMMAEGLVVMANRMWGYEVVEE